MTGAHKCHTLHEMFFPFNFFREIILKAKQFDFHGENISEFFGKKFRQIEGRPALLSLNVNKLSQIFFEFKFFKKSSLN